MRNGHININCTQRILPIRQVYGVCVAAVHRCSICLLLPRIINAALNYANYTITPSIFLINNKCYVSQDSIYRLHGRSIFVVPARASSFSTACLAAGYFMLRHWSACSAYFYFLRFSIECASAEGLDKMFRYSISKGEF